MKKTVVLLLTGILAVGSINAYAAQQTETNQEAVTKAYTEVVDKYATAENEKWDLDKLEEESLSLLTFFEYDNGLIGYQNVDLNHDGITELLIGARNNDGTNSQIIFDAYTYKNGQAEKLFESAERNRYYIIFDEAESILIANEASNGAANSANFYYIYDGDQLSVVQGIILDGLKDPEHPYFMTSENSWDVEKAEPIEEQLANDIMVSYSEKYAALDYMPVSSGYDPDLTYDSTETPQNQTASDSAIIETLNQTLYVTANALNVRAGSSTSDSVIGTLSYGDPVSAIGYVDNGWYQISYHGQTGYVSAVYVSDTEPAVQQTEVQQADVQQTDVSSDAEISGVGDTKELYYENGNTVHITRYSDGSWVDNDGIVYYSVSEDGAVWTNSEGSRLTTYDPWEAGELPGMN